VSDRNIHHNGHAVRIHDVKLQNNDGNNKKDAHEGKMLV